MSRTSGSNKVFMNDIEEDVETFRYDFITLPWDDRSKNSKIGIIVLLLAILLSIMACTCHYFYILYDGYTLRSGTSNNTLTCHMVKVDDYSYIARVHLIKNSKAICVGAVMSSSVVLTNDDCVQAGPIVIRVGSWSKPRCRKDFAVDIIENLRYENGENNKFVLLRTLEKINKCANSVRVDSGINWNATAYVIGRVQHGGKLLSRQAVELVKENCSFTDSTLNTLESRKSFSSDLICVKALSRCPIVAGDLLMQGGRLYGSSLMTSPLGRRQALLPFSLTKKIPDLINSSDIS